MDPAAAASLLGNLLTILPPTLKLEASTGLIVLGLVAWLGWLWARRC
jgi:hypothetical protein